MLRLLPAILVSAAILSPMTAHAFGIPKVPGLSSSSNSGSADLTASQEQLVKDYVAASKNVVLGNASLADALGLKDDAAKLRQSGEALGEGATKDNLADADKATSEAAKSIAAKLKDTKTLDAESKKHFATGLATLGAGMLKYANMKGSFESFSNGLKSASAMVLPKLQSGAYIVSTLPGNVKNVGSALQTAIAFAKERGVDIPADATAAF